MSEKTRLDKITEICLKRGIFYPNSEIYGSMSGFYDYGSVGAKIKRAFENEWRKYFLCSLKEPFHEIDPSIITPEKVWKASGHLDHFEDPVVQCKKCKLVERADQILEKELKQAFEGLSANELNELIRKNNIRCHQCKGELSDVGALNLMFSFDAGFFDAKTRAYLRPETAQCPYVSFKREYLVNRETLPFGLAVIGKAFRNEISPRRLFFRMREFTQAECQIFFDPSEINEHPRFSEVADYELRVVLAKERDKKEQIIKASELVSLGYPRFCVYYMARVQQFYESLGMPLERIRFFEKNESERAFYNRLHFDVEAFFDMFNSYLEVAGFHYRGDHDLAGHEKVSGEKMSVARNGKRFIPHVLELSFGVDRSVFAFIDAAYREEGERVWLSLPKPIAPYEAGLYPLMKKDGLAEKAEEIYGALGCCGVFYDDSGSIGKRYARADEIGVPFGFTVDHQTLEDGTVTVRERDTTKQKRIKASEIRKFLTDN
ncbi:MAG: glycine--tRNA ligase [archaeon]